MATSTVDEACPFPAVMDSLWQSSMTSVLNPLQSHWLLTVMEMIGDNNFKYITQNRAYKFLQHFSNKSGGGRKMSNSSVRGYQTQEHQIWWSSNQAEHQEQPLWSGDWPYYKSNQFRRFAWLGIPKACHKLESYTLDNQIFKDLIRHWNLPSGQEFRTCITIDDVAVCLQRAICSFTLVTDLP